MRRAKSDSTAQRAAEPLIVEAFARGLGALLQRRRLPIGDGRNVEIDAANEDLTIMCEVYARCGATKSAQDKKVMTDAVKLAFARDALSPGAQLYLLFCDPATAAKFLPESRTWMAGAIQALRIQVVLVSIDARHTEAVRDAQWDQNLAA